LTNASPTRHEITEAANAGWDKLENGALLAAAEDQGFEIFVTSDKNLAYQQNLSTRKIAIVVLGKGQWPAIQPFVEEVREAVNAATPGSFTEVSIPFPFPKRNRPNKTS
jgi:hypothetical protein